MHNYKGALRREQQDYTPTKSSWEDNREYTKPMNKPESRNESRNEGKVESKDYLRNDSKFENRYQKSELSYYQSQASRVVYDYNPSEKPSNKSQVPINDGEKYFYNDSLPVRIKSYEREEYETMLRIQIQNKVQKGQNMLLMYLTDDSNPKFLWTFIIKEMDFMNLKNQQKLKVSYLGFPEMVQNLLKECQDNPNSEGKNNYLVLSIKKGGQGKLSFIQSNKYKESTHLQFNFKLANDEQIKDHLSYKLLQANQDNEQNRHVISNMQNALSERMKELEQKEYELKATRLEVDKLEKEYELKEKKKVAQLQEKNWNQLNKLKRQGESQLKEVKNNLVSDNETLKKKLAEMNNNLSDYRQKIGILESTQRDQTNKINRLEQDLSKFLKETDQMRSDNRELSERRFQNEKIITELTCKVQSLKGELQDKKTIISSSVQLKETSNSQITGLEIQTTEQKRQITKLESKITDLEMEISKLNNSNRDFQEKILKQKEKLQERSDIMKEQEKQIKEIKRNESALERDNEKMRYQREDRENKIKNLHEQLEKIQKEYQDEHAMVQYLQKNLNERPPIRGTAYHSGNFQGSSSFTNVNRDNLSQISSFSSTTNSRIALAANNRVQKVDKYEPNIKRYEQRSKSPIINRLAQQKEPEQQQGNFQKTTKFQQPRAVKFKMSQPRQQEK